MTPALMLLLACVLFVVFYNTGQYPTLTGMEELVMSMTLPILIFRYMDDMKNWAWFFNKISLKKWGFVFNKPYTFSWPPRKENCWVSISLYVSRSRSFGCYRYARDPPTVSKLPISRKNP